MLSPGRIDQHVRRKCLGPKQLAVILLKACNRDDVIDRKASVALVYKGSRDRDDLAPPVRGITAIHVGH